MEFYTAIVYSVSTVKILHCNRLLGVTATGTSLVIYALPNLTYGSKINLDSVYECKLELLAEKSTLEPATWAKLNQTKLT